MKMSWGTELWDQYENIAAHTQRGIDFLEKYGHFIRDRCAIEMEYAGKLRKLVKNYQPKKKEDEDYQFSHAKSFLAMMNEVNDMAGQHEVIAENLTSSIIKTLQTLIRELKEERKKYLQEGTKVQGTLQMSLTQLDKTKKAYEKAFKESERAHELYRKADADINLSRAEVEKAKNLASLKNQACEDSKNEYANQLQKTNNIQREHYTESMPAIFQQLQDLDEKRITRLQEFLRMSVEIERNVFPIINTCLDGIIKASESVTFGEDSKLVIERYKSGFSPPDDIPFEDLSTMKNGESTPTQSLNRSETVKGTVSTGKNKKRSGIFGIFSSTKAIDEIKEDFSDLPPSQRKKKLQHKIDLINATINQETATRDALMRMKGVYEQNPALGDPNTLDVQLGENGQKLDKLRQELFKYQSYLDEAEGKVTPNSQKKNRASVSDESLSRSASDSSVSASKNASTPGTPLPSHCPNANLAPSRLSSYDAQIESNADLDQKCEDDIYSDIDCVAEPPPVAMKSSDSKWSLLTDIVTALEGTEGCPISDLAIVGSSNSPESGIETSHTSIVDSDFDTADNGEAEYAEPLPVLGSARARYPFEGLSEGSIPMQEGEEFSIMGLDQGDGWTRVRRATNEEGFVPTSYIDCYPYEN